jgi:Zn-dependent M28 family amino/carboxypeptidase
VFDNASGVAGALEIARCLATSKDPPARSVIFLFTTGEEKGLLGSYFYSEHPVVPLHRTIANLNIDGLALTDTFRDVVGIGSELSTLGRTLNNLASHLNLEVSPLPPLFSRTEAFNRSDQAAFAEAGVPSILIMEGLKYEHMSQEQAIRRFVDWGKDIYHSPFDDLHQELNYQAALQHCEFLLAFCRKLASDLTPPEWLPGVSHRQARFRSVAGGR